MIIRRLVVAWLLLCLAVAAWAQGDSLLLTGAGGKFRATTAAAYVGPGDVVSGASAWVGLRGYNGAFSGNVATVCDSATGLVCANATWSGSTLSLPTIGGIACNNIANVCVVSKLFDQSGNGKDLTQATLSKMPTLTIGCLGSFPCLTFASASNQSLESAGLTINRPLTFVAAAYKTSGTSYQNIASNYDSTNLAMFFFTGATLNCYDAGDNTFAITGATWHTAQMVAAAAGFSHCVIDGSDNTYTGSSEKFSAEAFGIGSDAANDAMNGNMFEAGVWPSGFTVTGNTSAMDANIKNYWGF